MSVSALALGLIVPSWLGIAPWASAQSPAVRELPEKAQIIDQKSFLVLPEVLPPTEANATTVSHVIHTIVRTFTNLCLQKFLWPGVTEESLLEKPFHIYDPEFYDVIGSNPSLTQIAESADGDILFHEAVTW